MDTKNGALAVVEKASLLRGLVIENRQHILAPNMLFDSALLYAEAAKDEGYYNRLRERNEQEKMYLDRKKEWEVLQDSAKKLFESEVELSSARQPLLDLSW